MSTYLITGGAGFIGAATARRLLAKGHKVVAVDCINDYYDPALKTARLEELEGQNTFSFHKLDITDADALHTLVAKTKPDVVINLAAQAGVRYSVQNAAAYGQSNLVGFLNVLEACRHNSVPHLVYASSSSVYGGNEKTPFHEDDPVIQPQSLYAATKRANELMAQSYAHLYGLKSTGLRFFTVYGPWGRPDMAPMLFADKILKGEAIKVFNHGELWRDFTFIDDIVEGVVRVADLPPTETPPHRVLNIGNSQPVKLMDFIQAMETAFGKKAVLDMQPLPPTEVLQTYADTSKIEALTGFKPNTPLSDGLQQLADWYVSYYKASAA